VSASPKFAISLIGMKRPEGTKACLDRMLQAAPKDCLFFLTSNGCARTAEVFQRAARGNDRIRVTVNTENLGFQIPHKKQFNAAAQAGCEYVLIANDDIEVPDRFLEILAEPMDRNPQVVITGPEGNCGFLNHEFHGEPGNGEPEYIEMSCGLIRVKIIQQLRATLWCPGLSFCYGEDSSLSLFVREKGYQTKAVPLHVSHIRSVTVNSDPEVKRLCHESQEHNHRLNTSRWGYYLKHRRFDLPIVVKRSYAIGDVILMEPIIRAIKRSRPLSPIHVETDFPELFEGHPDVVQAAKRVSVSEPALRVNLDDSYEQTVGTHVLDAYWAGAAEVITGLEPHDWTTRLFPSQTDMVWAQQQIGDSTRVALLSTDDTTWVSKNWPKDRMKKVADWLMEQGWTVFAIGSKDRMTPSSWNVKNFVGQTSLMQLASLCSQAQLMVTPCTSSLHLAQAMGCPTVGVFGITRARYITTRGSRLAAVESDESVHGSGMRHKVIGHTHVDVGSACMESISVDSVIRGIERLTT
jgi:ADP-heptose:LPS heptosyltransferase